MPFFGYEIKDATTGIVRKGSFDLQHVARCEATRRGTGPQTCAVYLGASDAPIVLDEATYRRWELAFAEFYKPTNQSQIDTLVERLQSETHRANAAEAEVALLVDQHGFFFANGIPASNALYDRYADELCRRFGRSTRASARQRAEAFLKCTGKWVVGGGG